MPCMGPEQPNDNDVNELWGKFMLLITKNGLLKTPNEELSLPMLKSRTNAKYKLRYAVKDLLWQDACENF